MRKWIVPRRLVLPNGLPESWQWLAVEELVSQVAFPVPLEQDVEYDLLGVKWYGAGVFHRETLAGRDIEAKSLFRAVPGAFIYNRLFAWKQSFAVVPEEHSNALVSGEFPQFLVDETRVLAEYLRLFVLTPEVTALVNGASAGSAAVSRNRFKESEFLRFEIPLPSLETQRAIVEQAQGAKADYENGLREVAVDADNIVSNVLHEGGIDVLLPERGNRFFAVAFGEVERWSVEFNRYLWRLDNLITSSKFSCVALKDVAAINPGNDSIALADRETLVSFVPMEAVSQVTGEIIAPQLKPFSAVSKGYTRFREDDLLWAKITPCMQNGKSAIAANLENDVGFGSTEFHVVRADSTLVLPRFLWLLLRLKKVLNAAQRYFTGSAGQQRVPAEFLSQLHIPIPPLATQALIVERALEAERSLVITRQRLESDYKAAQVETENRILGKAPSAAT